LFLDTDENVSGKLSLKNAVAAKNVDAAIEGQDRVNGIVLTETGESVIGKLEVSYRGSTRGEVLALNDAAAFGYIFRITNKTNKHLDGINIAAAFTTPREAWSGSVSIVGGSGQALSLRPFDPSAAADAGAFRDVQVNVVTPPGSAKGQSGKLKFSASVAPPISIGNFDTVPLTVDDAPVAAQPSSVKFLDSTPVTEEGNPANATKNESVVLRFDIRYTTTVGASPRDFVMKIVTTNTVADFALFDISTDIGIQGTTSKSKTSNRFTLRDGQQQSVLVQVVPGGGAGGKTLALDFTVEAVDDATVSVTRPRPITVKP